MIIEQRIKEFEKLGFGMFVHFGLYSIVGKGEWYKSIYHVSDEEYEPLAKQFNPDKNWAKELVATAKKAGCKYITLTTRHHDGYSLFDTCGLNDYDAPHSCGRDLVREFVDECNAQGIVPFFYHTLLDWREKSFENDFNAYLVYLRKSVELICKNYGKIGGLWFDGMWSKPDDDWQEDELYATIRKYQPQAMIINNTGLSAQGALGHIELDSVTFERGRPGPINQEGAPKYVASEMCQIFGDHWAFAPMDFHYKSLPSIIEDLCVCRRFGSNFLLNVGPQADGLLRPLDKAMLEELGRWVEIEKEALYLPRPCTETVTSNDKDFLLEKDGEYYIFCHNMQMALGDGNVVKASEGDYLKKFTFAKKIKSVRWLDNGEDVAFVQNGNEAELHCEPFRYGEQLVVRVAKITAEN